MSKITKRLKKSLKHASRHAASQHQREVEPINLLFGLCKPSDSIAAEVLNHRGINQGRILEMFPNPAAKAIKSTVDPRTLDLDKDADRACEISAILADLDQRTVGPEDLLAALMLIEDKRVKHVLKKVGVVEQQIICDICKLTGDPAPAMVDLRAMVNQEYDRRMRQLAVQSPDGSVRLSPETVMGMLGGSLSDALSKLRPQPRPVSMSTKVTKSEYINPDVLAGKLWQDTYMGVVNRTAAPGDENKMSAAEVVEYATTIADGAVEGFLRTLGIEKDKDVTGTNEPTREPAFEAGDRVVFVKDWNEPSMTEIPEFTIQDATWSGSVWLYALKGAEPGVVDPVELVAQDDLVEKSVVEVEQRERQNQANNAQDTVSKAPETNDDAEWEVTTEGDAVGTNVYVLPAPGAEIAENQEVARVSAMRSKTNPETKEVTYQYQVNGGNMWLASNRVVPADTKKEPVAAGDASVVG